MDQKKLFERFSNFRKGTITQRQNQNLPPEDRNQEIVNIVASSSSLEHQTAPQGPHVERLASSSEYQPRVQPAQFQGAENTVLHSPQLNNIAGNFVVVNNHYNAGIENINSDTSQDLAPKRGLKSGPYESNNDARIWPPTQPPLLISKSSDIYYRHLAVEERGYPLWIPEPNNRCPIEYQRKGISIGDVGIITPSGSFDVLFNICLPADHPINMNEVPDGFVPLEPPLKQNDIRGQLEFRCDSYIASASVTTSSTQDNGDEDPQGLTFEATASEGAILTIPNGALSEDLGNSSRFRGYTGNNVESWYRYFNGPRGREAKNGDIRLVVGVDKTTAWGMATFANMTENHKFRLRFKSNSQGSTGSMYRWECFGGRAQVRAGPDAREIAALRNEAEDSPSAYENQSLFVRTLNATLSDEIWERITIESAVEHDLDNLQMFDNSNINPSNSQLPSGSIPQSSTQDPRTSGNHSRAHNDIPSALLNGRTGSIHIEDFPVARTAHPSKALNEALLRRFPSSKIVITEDINWIMAIKEQNDQRPRPLKTLPPREELVPLVLAMHRVCQEGDITFLELAGPSHPALLEDNATNQLEYGLDDLHQPWDELNPKLTSSSSSQTIRPKPRNDLYLKGNSEELEISLLESTYSEIETVKIYKQECYDVTERCFNFMMTLPEISGTLEEIEILEIINEIETIITRMNRKMKEWSSLSQLKSFLWRTKIKDGIDSLNRDIDVAAMKCNIKTNAAQSRATAATHPTTTPDKGELRNLLQEIVNSNVSMKALLHAQSSSELRPVEEIMECLQTELMDLSLNEFEREIFKAGLWDLHEKTAKLPPLTDLSGQITVGVQLATGSFSDIYLGEWLGTEQVTLRLPRSLVDSHEDQHSFQRQVSAWRELDHPNIVPIYGVIYQNEVLYYVSPWMENGNVVEYLKKHPTDNRLQLLIDAASGLEYLHSKGVIHGDIRGSNLLISKDGIARLSDFGLSKFVEDCGKGMNAASNNINPRWFAPELIQQIGPASTHSDVWSFGMLCLEILSGDVPYANISRDLAVHREVDNGKLPTRPGRVAASQGLSDEMWNLMRKCWQKKPETRPSIADIKYSLLKIRGLPLPISPTPPVKKDDVGSDEISLIKLDDLVSNVDTHTTAVEKAITDSQIIININESGMVTSGTLEGLVEHFITTINTRNNAEFRDALLTACADFTTPEKLFSILSRRFYNAESDSNQHPERRVALQYNIFMAIMYWLSNHHLPVDFQLLNQMRTFCETASRMKTSETMANKSSDLLKLIDDRLRQDDLRPPTSPRRAKLQASQITPKDLAIALTLLEGDKYKALVPSDYIAHLRRYPGENRVQGVYTTNNEIVCWVKESVLHYDGVEQRADVLKFFINTAEECRKLRNFSSLVAIASALHSAPIERLRLTKAALRQQMQAKYYALEDIISPSANHREYRAAVNDTSDLQQRDQCIPWLAVHLKELHLILQRYPTTIVCYGQPLINFERYVKFMDRVREVLHYQPPDLEQYRHRGELIYLENQLGNLKMSPPTDDEMTARSKMLEALEDIYGRTRRAQLKTLGFRTNDTT